MATFVLRTAMETPEERMGSSKRTASPLSMNPEPARKLAHVVAQDPGARPPHSVRSNIGSGLQPGAGHAVASSSESSNEAANAAQCEDNRWPIPAVARTGSSWKFLFILTPPYSGSTALAKVLKSSSKSMLLNERGEGQWLVPGMCEPDRWDHEKTISWDSVEAVWSARVQLVESLVGSVQVVIEKSPPNIVRANQLVHQFPNSTLVTFNRNPYANCASSLYRNHEPQGKTEVQRIQWLRHLAQEWATRSTWVRRWNDEFETISLTYEQFCEDPSASVKRIVQGLPELSDVDVTRPIRVKDYPLQGIQNQNERQISFLTAQERSAIGEELELHSALLAYFGYDNCCD